MMRLLIAALVAVLTALPSHAWLIQGGRIYIGPGDIVPFTYWGGLRAYSSAVAETGTALMMNIRKPATGEYCDVLVAVTGGMGLTANCTSSSDGLTVSAFCAGADCRIKKLYDQTGNNACGGMSCDMVQSTEGSQPRLLRTAGFNWIFLTNPPEALRTANDFTPSTGVLSFSAAGLRNINLMNAAFMGGVGSGNELGMTYARSGQWRLTAAGVSLNRIATDGLWHAGHGVVNGGSSVLRLDASEVTGALTGSTTPSRPFAGNLTPGGSALREHGFIDNYALSTVERAALEGNMRAYWSF